MMLALLKAMFTGHSRVCVFTAKHTGTHWTMNQLVEMGYKQAFIEPKGHGFEFKPKGPIFYHLHVEERFHFHRNVKPTDLVITTIRDPRNVFYSHAHRRPYTQEQCEATALFSFAKWRDMVDQYNPYIYQVDGPRRVEQTMEIAEMVGADDYDYMDVSRNSKHEFTVDWPLPESIERLALDLGYAP